MIWYLSIMYRFFSKILKLTPNQCVIEWITPYTYVNYNIMYIIYIVYECIILFYIIQANDDNIIKMPIRFVGVAVLYPGETGSSFAPVNNKYNNNNK